MKRLSHEEYLVLIESLAKDVISAALKEESFEVFLPDGEKSPLQEKITILAQHLRYMHTHDDGCIVTMCKGDEHG